MLNAIHDLQLAIRQLRRSWTFTFAVILTLGIGIGLNAAIFSMVDCILLRPLGYHDADRIYGVNTRFTREGRSIPRIGGGDFSDLARQATTVQYAAYYETDKAGIQLGAQSLFTDVAMVSPAFGQAIGVEPVAGRLFPVGAGQAEREAMVSASFAREHFSSAAGAIGQSLKVEGVPRPIVGVLPDGFSFPDKTQVWIELKADPAVQDRGAYNQRALVKLKPGVTAAELRAELGTLSGRLSQAFAEDKFKAIEAVPLQDQIVGGIRPVLRLLMGSVVVVLLIVCANITHLQLVRATRLRREVTIRTALGATRTTLTRRAAMEVLALSVAGCAAGIAVALPALRVLVRLAPQDIPRLEDVRLNFDVVGISFLVSLASMTMAALVPLWRSWKVDPASAMKQDAARGMESRGSGRLRQTLIVGEVALSLTLSVAAVLLVRQLIDESKQDLGFAPDHLLMVDTHMTGTPNGPADVATVAQMVERTRNTPGVTSAAAVTSAPMGPASSDVGYAVRGRSEFKPPYANLANASIMAATPGYFETMGIPLLKGRAITETDRAGSPLVVVVSETLARQSFAGRDPIGQQIAEGWDDQTGWHTIVGVVGDVRQESPASKPYPTFYVPVAQHPTIATDIQLVARTRADAGALAGALARTIKQNFPRVSAEVTIMRENVGESERGQHFRTLLFGSLAGVAILLSITGMYGVTAYTVAQRRFEFALRFALGAQRGQVLGGVLRGAMALAGAGVLGGIALSLALMRVLSTLLGSMPAFDAASYAIAAAGVLLVALSATLPPAWRAATVEPMRVLRDE